MSKLMQIALLSVSGQVLMALESIAARTNRLPTPQQVQKEMRRLKLKSLSASRIGQHISSLEKKGCIVRTFSIVKKQEEAKAIPA